MIMPATDFTAGGSDQADARTIKTLLSITGHHDGSRGAELPLAVAEIFDSRKIEIARAAYGGRVEILASDAIIGERDWLSLVHTTGDQEFFEKKYGQATPESVTQFLTFDEEYSSSILSSVSLVL